VRRAVPSRESAQAWIQARAEIPAPIRAVFRTPVCARILASGHAVFRTPVCARILPRTRAVFRVTACAGLLVRIRVVSRMQTRAGSLVPVRAVASHPAAGLVPGLAFARNLVRAGWPDQATVRHLASRSPPLLARRPSRTPWARGGPVMPIRVSARGPVHGPGRIPVPGQAPVGLDQDQIPGPVAVRRPGSARAPMRGSGQGPGRTGCPRRGAALALTAGHDLMPRVALARPRRPARPGLHGLPEQNGRAAIPVPAPVSVSVPRTGTVAAGRPARPLRLAPQGRAAGVLSRVPNHCRPTRARPCRTRPSAPGAAVATVPAAARMRAVQRKRWRGKRACDAAAGGVIGPSSRPQRTVRPPRAVVSCWAAMRRRDATRSAAGRAKADPPGGDTLRAATRRAPGRGTLVPPRRRVTSGSRTKPGLAGEGHVAGPRISRLSWIRPARTTGPAAARGPPGPVPGLAGAGAVPCCWPCWRSWSSRPGRWPR
jgi:hypothetical protein